MTEIFTEVFFSFKSKENSIEKHLIITFFIFLDQQNILKNKNDIIGLNLSQKIFHIYKFE